MISSVRYINSIGTLFEAVVDGRVYQTVAPQGEVHEAIQAWVKAGNTPDPYVPPCIPPSPIDGAIFLGRFTDDELTAIYAHAASPKNIQVMRWIDMLRMRGEIDVNGTTAQAAKAGLVAAGLVAQQRADEVFAP